MMTNFAIDSSSLLSSIDQWKSFINRSDAITVDAIHRNSSMARNNAIVQGIGAVVMHANMVQTIDRAGNQIMNALHNTGTSVEWGATITVAAIDDLRRDNAFHTELLLSEITQMGVSVNRVHRDLVKLTALMDYRTQVIVDKLTLSNDLLENLGSKMMIPDFQKERIYYMQQGLKHYRNGRKNPDLNHDALANLLKAEEKETGDYLVLYYIGMLYLYGIGTMDPEKAELYLLRAAKYAGAEIYDSVTPVSKNLDIGHSGKKQSAKEETNYRKQRARQLSTTAWIEASIAAFAQTKLDEARDHAKCALSLKRSDSRAGLQYLKAVCALGDAVTAHAQVRFLLNKSLVMAIPMAADTDIIDAPGVLGIIFSYRDAYRKRLEKSIEDLDAEHGNPLRIDEKTGPLLDEIRKNLDENTVLSVAVADSRMNAMASLLPQRAIIWRRQVKELQQTCLSYQKWVLQYESIERLVTESYPYASQIRQHASYLRGLIANRHTINGDSLRQAVNFLGTSPKVDFRQYRDLFNSSDKELEATMMPDYDLMNLTGQKTSSGRRSWASRVRYSLLAPTTLFTHLEAVTLERFFFTRRQATL